MVTIFAIRAELSFDNVREIWLTAVFRELAPVDFCCGERVEEAPEAWWPKFVTSNYSPGDRFLAGTVVCFWADYRNHKGEATGTSPFKI